MKLNQGHIENIVAKIDQAISTTKRQSPMPFQPTFGGFHESAAVLGRYSPRELTPTSKAVTSDSLDELLANSTVIEASRERCWTLLPDVRIQTLRQLRKTQRVRQALEANTPQIDDIIGKKLRNYLSNDFTKIPAQSMEDLGITFQVVNWLRQAGYSDIPDLAEISRQLEWLTLLQPFEHLAGDQHFRGRKSEIEKIRNFVGILPPTDNIAVLGRFIRRSFNLETKPPLLIFGPGGVGKSTLVSRFILEHARAHEQDRFPFAYLDFDRPEIEPGEPLTLLIEAVRQLGIQYPEALDRCLRIRKLWTSLLVAQTSDSTVTQAQSRTLINSKIAREFSQLIDTLSGDRPVLFVLDTFEEVQYRGTEKVHAIWKMIDELQTTTPKLRVVLVGRNQVANFRSEHLALGNLDYEATLGYLRAHGIKFDTVLKRLATLTNGNPLSLRLAIDLTGDKNNAIDLLEGIKSHGFLWRLQDGEIQRQLYDRILNHIHDEDVRKLAHPGLILRRITPDLILRVLAKPCDLSINSLSEATNLLGKLQQEISLVNQDSDGALVHRQDLRRLMINLLRNDNPTKVRVIHKNAVAYYETLEPTPVPRGEEIYHRLCLGHDTSIIDARWIQGVEDQLFSSLEEFSGSRKAYLASRLGVEVDEATRAAASLEDWERIVERKVQDLIKYGETESALQLIRSRPDRSSSSPLFSLEAIALSNLGRHSESMKALYRGIEAAYTLGEDREQAFRLVIAVTDQIFRSGDTREASHALKWIKQLIEHKLPPLNLLALLARQALLIQHTTNTKTERTDVIQKCWETFDLLPDDLLSENIPLCCLVGTTLDLGERNRLARVIHVAGLPRTTSSAIRNLASELALLNIPVPSEGSELPGPLSQESTALASRWTNFILTGSEQTVRHTLTGLITNLSRPLSPRLFAALQSVFFQALGFQKYYKASGGTASPDETRTEGPFVGTNLELGESQKAQLINIIVESFSSPSRLADFLHHRLNQNLDTISTSNNFSQIAADLISLAETNGWLAAFIAKAREAHPFNVGLTETANEVGFSTLLSNERIITSAQKWFNATPSNAAGTRSFWLWKNMVNSMEGRICRVEVRKGDSFIFGTGFLVGPNLLLTADYLLSDVLAENVPPTSVTLRFDYKELVGGITVTTGTEYHLEPDWLVARSSIGYALVRISNSPGSQPLGGFQAESMPVLRGWLRVFPDETKREETNGMLIIYHEMNGPLQLYYDDKVNISYDMIEKAIYYQATTPLGSGGAPCFTRDFNLVALHMGTANDGRAYGIPIKRILLDLKHQGLPDIIKL